MNQDPAWRIIQSAFRCSAELQELLAFLKNNADAEYEQYRLPIAAVVDAVGVQLIGSVLASRPELEKRIETELANSGRIG